MSASKTFERLNEQKRHAFLEAAFKEFSLKGYDAASITQLVKALGIAKGSVYQYFDDKQDLYKYLIETAFRTIEKLTNQACPSTPGEDYKEWLLRYLLVQLKIQLGFPHYALLLQRIDIPADLAIESIHREIRNRWMNLAVKNAPKELKENDLMRNLVGSSSRSLFQNLIHTNDIDLIEVIGKDSELTIPGERLLAISSSWVNSFLK